MELVPLEACVLCDESTAVLPSSCVTPYMNYINTTFFDKNKNGLDCFQKVVADRSFCVLCAHKILTSHKFRDIYENICNKCALFKKRKTVCFICESKSADLIRTDSNPNDFHVKIKTFMDSTLWSRPYLQCVVCFDCVFSLSIWFEMNLYIMKKIDGESVVKTPEKLSKTPNENAKNVQSPFQNTTPNGNDGLLLSKGKENITPPESNHISQKQSNSENDSPSRTLPQKRKRKFTGEITKESGPNHCLNGSSINENTENKDLNTEASKELHSFLKQVLKNLKPVREINFSEYPENVLNDKKMFNSIPYVLMSKDDKPATRDKTKTPKSRRLQLKSLNKTEEGSRKSSRLNKPIEVIDLMDSNSEVDENADELKNNTNQSSLKPNRFKLSLKRKPTIKLRMSSRSSVIQSSPSKYSCNICDQEFEVNYEYKAHCLWHEKPDNIVIDVTRHNLPKQTKASLFTASQPTQKGENKIPHADSEIDKLLKKYGTLPTDTFEDSDCNDSNEIANIIENLNSQDDEESKDGSKPEKNEGIDVDLTKNDELNNGNDTHKHHSKESGSNSSHTIRRLSSQEEEQLKNDSLPDKNKEVIVDSHDHEHSKNISNTDGQLSEDSDCGSTKDIEKSNSQETEQSEDENEANKTKDLNVNLNKHEDAKNENDIGEQQAEESNCEKSEDDENITDELNMQEKKQSEAKSKQKNQKKKIKERKKHDDTENEQNSDYEAASPNANLGKWIKRVEKNKESQTKSKESEVEKESKNNVEQTVNVESNSASEESCEDMNQAEAEESDADMQPATETKQNCTESDLEDVEVGLARIHGEEQLSESENSLASEICIDDADEKAQGSDSGEENDKQLNKSKNNDLINVDEDSKETTDISNEKEENNDSCSEESDDVEDKKEENGNENSKENNIKKRRRVGSLVVVDDKQEDNSCDEIVTPKAKKVRFAIDYQSPKSLNIDAEPDVISNDEQNDESGSNGTEEIVLRIEDSSSVE